MDQALELTEISEVQSFSPSKETTIKALLEELGLERKTFSVLVNGKKVDINQRVSKTDSIVILPQIAGGCESIESDLKNAFREGLMAQYTVLKAMLEAWNSLPKEAKDLLLAYSEANQKKTKS